MFVLTIASRLHKAPPYPDDVDIKEVEEIAKRMEEKYVSSITHGPFVVIKH